MTSIARAIICTFDNETRTLRLDADFFLGVPMGGEWRRGNTSFSPVGPQCTNEGQKLVQSFMAPEARDGWTRIQTHDAYSFTLTWGALFKADPMVDLLLAILKGHFGVIESTSIRGIAKKTPMPG